MIKVIKLHTPALSLRTFQRRYRLQGAGAPHARARGGDPGQRGRGARGAAGPRRLGKRLGKGLRKDSEGTRKRDPEGDSERDGQARPSSALGRDRRCPVCDSSHLRSGSWVAGGARDPFIGFERLRSFATTRCAWRAGPSGLGAAARPALRVARADATTGRASPGARRTRAPPPSRMHLGRLARAHAHAGTPHARMHTRKAKGKVNES